MTTGTKCCEPGCRRRAAYQGLCDQHADELAERIAARRRAEARGEKRAEASGPIHDGPEDFGD